MNEEANLRSRSPLPTFHQYRGFLDESECETLLDWAVSNCERFRPSTVFGGVLDAQERSSERLPDLGPMETVFQRRLRELFPDILARTGTRSFEVDVIELELVAHGDGAHFARHIDIPVGPGRLPLGGDGSGQDRLLSAVHYFHDEPKSFSGGALRLHRYGSEGLPGDFVDIEPENNSLLVFPSWALHEVRQIRCPSGAFRNYRFAVNAWFCKVLALGRDE